jgi:hypothetical protein
MGGGGQRLFSGCFLVSFSISLSLHSPQPPFYHTCFGFSTLVVIVQHRRSDRLKPPRLWDKLDLFSAFSFLLVGKKEGSQSFWRVSLCGDGVVCLAFQGGLDFPFSTTSCLLAAHGLLGIASYQGGLYGWSWVMGDVQVTDEREIALHVETWI